MALSNATTSNVTTTSMDISVDTDLAGGTIYYLVSTGAPARIEPSAVVNFGQSITGFSTGTVDLGTWSNLDPTNTNSDFRRVYRLHVVHDPLDDGNLLTKVESDQTPTLNDEEMTPPASTVRYIEYDKASIDRDDALIQDWLASGGNVVSDNHTSVLSQAVTEGEYTITFSNPSSTTPNQDRVLSIQRAQPRRIHSFNFNNVAKVDYSANLDDISEFWGKYKYGDYLFCAKGGSTLSTDQCGIRVFDVSDVGNGNAPLVFSDYPRDSAGTGFVGLNHFLRTVQVKGTPGTAGAEAHVIFRSSPYTADDQASAIYKYDISDADPANWALATWSTGHQHLGGAGSPAYSVPLMSDMAYDAATDRDYVSSQKNGLRVYNPADYSTVDGTNNDYTPIPHETQGLCVDSSASGYVYLAAYINGLRIIDKATLSDGRYTIIKQQQAPNGENLRPWDCILSDDENWLFMSLLSDAQDGEITTSGLQVVDVHDPEKPQIVAIHVLTESNSDIFNGRHDPACVRINKFSYNQRNYLVLGNLGQGIALYDVTDPTRPVFINNNFVNLDTLGSERDRVGHACVWEDGGSTYIAYGDYGSERTLAGTKQLYIDELTWGNDMSVVIGNAAPANGLGTAYIAGGTSPVRGPSSDYDHTAVAGDYVDTLRVAVDTQPAARTVTVGVYRRDNGALVHSEDVEVAFPSYPYSGVTYVPLASRVYLTAGVAHTARFQHEAGGSNWEIDENTGTTGFEMDQYTPAVSGELDSSLPSETAYARDGIIALIGDNASSDGGGSAGIIGRIVNRVRR